MSDWNRAKKIIKKLFDAGYLSIKYGQIETPETNCHISYPLNEEETQFLVDYFRKAKNK